VAAQSLPPAPDENDEPDDAEPYSADDI
jgi:hypothetical protein